VRLYCLLLVSDERFLAQKVESNRPNVLVAPRLSAASEIRDTGRTSALVDLLKTKGACFELLVLNCYRLLTSGCSVDHRHIVSPYGQAQRSGGLPHILAVH
jgi:hypothetical protein